MISRSQSRASELFFGVTILRNMREIPHIWVHFGTFPSEFGSKKYRKLLLSIARFWPCIGLPLFLIRSDPKKSLMLIASGRPHNMLSTLHVDADTGV